MSTRLGEMLLHVGALTEEQLQQVLSAQSAYGGRIGTNLVEMGLLSEDDLGRLLNEKLGVPCVEPASLEQVSPSLIALLPQEMVQRLQVLPVAREGKRLTLAMKDPADFNAIDEVGFFTGLVIVPRVCTELRLSMALERYYGIKRVLTFIPVAGGMRTRMANITGLTHENSEPSAPGQDGPHVTDISSSLESTSHSQDAPSPSSLGHSPSNIAAQGAVPGTRNPGADDGGNSGSAPGDEIANPASGRMEVLARKFAAASAEVEVVSILMSYIKEEFDRAGLLSLRRGSAVGVQAVSCGSQVPNFTGWVTDLGKAELLKGVLEKRAPYLGKLPEGDLAGEILTKIGGTSGAPVLLLLLVVGGGIVAFLLVQDEKGRLASGLYDLQRVVAKAGLAFEMIGIRKKIGLV
jgi:hypothetical protein